MDGVAEMARQGRIFRRTRRRSARRNSESKRDGPPASRDRSHHGDNEVDGSETAGLCTAATEEGDAGEAAGFCLDEGGEDVGGDYRWR